LSFREFAVLCAIYAAIGAKRYGKVSLQMIRRYAAGHPREQDFQTALAQGRAGSLFLSPKQVRKTIDHLEANRFFAKFTYNRREGFYSHPMDKKAVMHAVANGKLRRRQTIYSIREQDAQHSARIQQRLAELQPRETAAQMAPAADEDDDAPF